MPLKAPNLDDRDFYQLVEEAKRIIANKCPQWTDLSPGDPGIVILELFAHLTETMIYRLNRLPEKAYVEFLRLIGVKLGPPEAASVKLRFSLSKAQDKPVEIPRGTRVTLARTGGGEPPPVFVVLQGTTIPAGQTQVDADAYHCELIEAEEAQKATGQPGLFVAAQRPPIVEATNEKLELIVGVEAQPDEFPTRVRSIEHKEKQYVIWREVEDFSNLTPRGVYCGVCGGRIAASDIFCAHCGSRQPKTEAGTKASSGNVAERQLVYIADRMTGTITFAPAARLKDRDGKLDQTALPLAEVPKAGRQIILWYCSGGGLAGNVAAETLTTLKDPIAGVTVTNPEPATGGSAMETLDNALIRGPQQLHSLQRAVTARDFELLALRSSGAVARAKAYTKARLWKHATPGTVEVLIVPSIPEEQRPDGVVTEEALAAHETEEAIATVQQSLDEVKPLGTTAIVKGVRYKEVKVEARAVIHRGENADAVRTRVLKRLHQTINPLPSSLPSAGWPFGQPLRVSNVYDIMLAEAGVSFVDNVRLVVDQVPEKDITALAADVFQPHTWYATTHNKVFRSMDDGDGWELINTFPDNEEIAHLRVNNSKPGQIAVVTNPSSGDVSRVYVSPDCGETWDRVAGTAFMINDLAWTSRGNESVLIMATDKGLHDLLLAPLTGPLLITVDPSKPSLGFNAVAAAISVRGTPYVAAAVRSSSGVSVYLSAKAGPSSPYSFEPLGLKDENVHVLEVQQDGARIYLWAGLWAIGNEPGKGAVRWELQGGSAGDPVPMNRRWDGGSCLGLAFNDSFAFAATHDKGVLWLDLSKKAAEEFTWRAPLKESGLKVREDEVHDFDEVDALASVTGQSIVMAGGSSGIYLSKDNGTSYTLCSNKVFADRVTVSPTRLFVSGPHDVAVVSEDEAK